jgi:hypothetical protein
MKKTAFTSLLVPGFIIIGLIFLCFPIRGQEGSKTSPALPEEVNKIVSASCTPCHTSDGGLMSRSKLNFTDWTNYTPEKQKNRASKMFSELNKGAMPPKSARAKRPELIPTKEQVEIIKKWSESLSSGSK